MISEIKGVKMPFENYPPQIPLPRSSSIQLEGSSFLSPRMISLASGIDSYNKLAESRYKYDGSNSPLA